MKARRGIRIARLASGITTRNSATRPTATHTPSSPARTEVTDVAIRNAVTSIEHMTRPWLMCALATCDQASAESAIHASRLDHRSACRYPDAPTSTTVVHAKKPANGKLIAISDVDISMARHKPPAAANSREISSLRRNQKIPSPASIGLNTTKARSAAPGESAENRTMGGP
jgi:hypothetical protein